MSLYTRERAVLPRRTVSESISWTGWPRQREGHAAVYLSDGAAGAAVVLFEAARRTLPPSTSWMGQPRRWGGQAAAHLLDRATEAMEPNRCPIIHLLMRVAETIEGHAAVHPPGQGSRGQSCAPRNNTARSPTLACRFAFHFLDGAVEVMERHAAINLLDRAAESASI